MLHMINLTLLMMLIYVQIKKNIMFFHLLM